VGVVTGMPHYHVTGDDVRYRGERRMREPMEGMDVLRVAVPQIARHRDLGRGLWHLNAGLASASARTFAREFDVAAVFSPPLFLALAPWWNHLPFLLNIQDIFPAGAVELGALRPGITLSLLQRAERWIYGRASLVTVHAPGQKRHFHELAPSEKVVHFPNWVETDEILPGERGNRFRRELGFADKTFVVSFAGVIGRAQGLDLVLRAAERLRAESNVVFLLIGDGLEKPALEASAARMGLSNVLFLPMQPKERYVEILAASDACLVTLNARAGAAVIPSKIGSIMSAGRPIIASLPDGDAAQLIRDANAGVIVPPNDATALAQAVIGCNEDAQLRARLGRNGRRYAVENLDVDVLAPRFIELLERCLEVGRGAGRQ
jgi:colanic acid biosynthesis glycosyl transferase WcaI